MSRRSPGPRRDPAQHARTPAARPRRRFAGRRSHEVGIDLGRTAVACARARTSHWPTWPDGPTSAAHAEPARDGPCVAQPETIVALSQALGVTHPCSCRRGIGRRRRPIDPRGEGLETVRSGTRRAYVPSARRATRSRKVFEPFLVTFTDRSECSRFQHPGSNSSLLSGIIPTDMAGTPTCSSRRHAHLRATCRTAGAPGEGAHPHAVAHHSIRRRR